MLKLAPRALDRHHYALTNRASCEQVHLVYHENEGEDPTQSLLTDTPIMINLCLWALTARSHRVLYVENA